jgi:magnesium transporter
VLTIFAHRGGKTEQVPSVDRTWLDSASGVILWIDLLTPTIPEFLILSDTFRFHPLSIEDAMASLQYPKIEAYDGYLYIVLHGIAFHEDTPADGPDERCFDTQDVDFFLGPNYLVTVHRGDSRSIREIKEHVLRNKKIMGEGPVALFHRIVDAMVDHYRPEVEQLEEHIDELENAVFERPGPDLIRTILDRKRDVSTLRRIVTPQRDVIGRLARREYADISTDMAFRFRDVYDHLVRVADDASMFHERLTSLLEAHLTTASNRLNEVMKVLTVVSTIFLPLTLLAGLWGMNVELPFLPGGPAAQFWWVAGIMLSVVVVMLITFARRRWI